MDYVSLIENIGKLLFGTSDLGAKGLMRGYANARKRVSKKMRAVSLKHCYNEYALTGGGRI